MKPVNIIVRKKDTNEIEFIKKLSPYQKNKESLEIIANALIKTYGDIDYVFDIDYRFC